MVKCDVATRTGWSQLAVSVFVLLSLFLRSCFGLLSKDKVSSNIFETLLLHVYLVKWIDLIFGSLGKCTCNIDIYVGLDEKTGTSGVFFLRINS